MYDYERDGNAIYARSFAIIRAEADLARFSAEEAEIAVRMIHACGLVEAARHFVFAPGLAAAARGALHAGAPILCDAAMVALWGLAFGAVPVAWSTWITRAVPDEAESAGGLFVATIQFAIATGAAAGGAMFDANGVTSVFVASGIVLFLAALTIVSAVRTRPA